MKTPTTKQALRRRLPLCVQCNKAWVSKAHRLTCSATCRRLYRMRKLRELTEPAHVPETLTFPKEVIL